MAATAPKCPNPKTCPVYRLLDEMSGGPAGGTKGWRADADGLVRIPFYVNPQPPPGSTLTEDAMEAAILEGFRIIEAAHLRLRFVYRGRTTRVPRPSDGFNDFTFGAKADVQHDAEGYIREADVRSAAATTGGDYTYTPCEQRDGGCTPTGGKPEVLDLMMHEQLHTLGLADLGGPDVVELTMFPGGFGGGSRAHVTLGLGDVLGLRAIYPTSAPMPPIYSP